MNHFDTLEEKIVQLLNKLKDNHLLINNLKNEGIWDHTKQKFGMDNLNKMIDNDFAIGDASGYHLRLLGYGDVSDLNSDIKQNKKEYNNALDSLEFVGQKPYRIVDYIKNNILEDINEDGMIIPRQRITCLNILILRHHPGL